MQHSEGETTNKSFFYTTTSDNYLKTWKRRTVMSSVLLVTKAHKCFFWPLKLSCKSQTSECTSTFLFKNKTICTKKLKYLLHITETTNTNFHEKRLKIYSSTWFAFLQSFPSFIKESISDYLFNAVFEFLQTSSSSSVLRPSPSSDFIAIASCLVHRITLGPI